MNNKKTAIKTIITFLFIIIIGVFCMTGCENGIKIRSRNATTNDLYIDLPQNISLSMNFKVTPNVNIENLELTFKFCNSNNKTLSTKVKRVGNVSKNIEYSISISLSEFSFLDLFKITNTKVSVTNGIVYY